MIVQAGNLASVRKKHENERVTLLHGAFDYLHLGHIAHLSKAKQLGDIAIVAVCSDENIRERKGEVRPIHKASARMAVLCFLRPVDYVFELQGEGYPDDLMMPHIETLEPDYYLLSNPKKQQPFGDESHYEHPSGRVTELVYDKTYGDKVHSTTDIIRQLHAIPKGA